MKKKLILVILLVLFYPLSIHAITVDQYVVQLDNPAIGHAHLGAEKYGYQGVLSNYYEFIDENGKYNIIYTLTEDSNHLGWVVLNHKKEKEKEILIEKSLPMFGNAIYDNGFLYVVTGKKDTVTPTSVDAGNYPLDYGNVVVLSVTKYDSNGKKVNQLEITGRETSRLIKALETPGTKNFSYLASGAKIPFDAGNCDIAIHDGNLIIVFAKEMYNGHQMNYISVVDKTTLEHVSKPTELEDSNPYFNITRGGYWTSHSFDQRVITTSDGGLLLADQGDAFERGFVISKIYKSDKTYNIKSETMFNFRESSAYDPYGYNTTFANMGSLVEVEDGYLFVASSEKTLSINYSNNRYMNEGRNLFIQKYKKDFENQSIETLSLLDTPIRSSEEVRTDKELDADFKHPNKVIKDYGVKWLTDYSDKTTVLGSRAVKLDDNTVAILWSEQAIKNGGSGIYNTTGDIHSFFEIIDSNGNIIEDKTEIENASLTNLIHYNTDGKYIYWTQKGTGNTLIVNRLEVDGSVELDSTGAEMKIGERKKVVANSSSKLTWTSSDPSIVSVDQQGNLLAKKEGNAIITITTRSSKVNYYVTVKKSTIKEEMEEIFHIITNSIKANFNPIVTSKLDINRDGKIDVVDIISYARLIFIRI